MSNKSDAWNISYKQLGIICISFILGVIFALLLSNSQATSSTNFSTTELIGFVLSVILSGASIVLAISAIALGKSSEQVLISRSDDSIRLQTEVYTQTTDALQSIKASTGVTEKRIEDIISGRAGDISLQLAELARNETSGDFDITKLEEKVKKSLINTLENKDTDEERKKRQKRRDEYKQKREEYEKYHNKLVYALANKDNIKILKIGHGTPSAEQVEEFSCYDAVLEKNADRIAISTLEPIEGKVPIRIMGDIITGLAKNIESDNISKLHLVLFEQCEDDDVFKNIKGSLSMLKDELSSKIIISGVRYSDIDTWAENLEL